MAHRGDGVSAGGGPRRGRRVTVVMYHYVRDLARSRYPDIKGLTLEEFRGQIEYVRRHYRVVGAGEILDAVTSTRPLPARALLLTFDDGYRDHLSNVVPVLTEHGLTGCFFPPAKAVLERSVLDVNKIHFVLAAVADKALIVDSLFALIDGARAEFGLRDRSYYVDKLAHPTRFDTAEVVLIKRLLQRELPELLRKRATDELFTRYVTTDQAAFSQELYMDLDELRSLSEAGMYVGSHGFDHFWLDSLDAGRQATEVDLSLDFLQRVATDSRDWMIAFPYGAYDDSLLRVLRDRDCRAGFTTEVRIADLDLDDPLTLPRIDTNDLPKRGDAAAGEWTARVLREEGGR